MYSHFLLFQLVSDNYKKQLTDKIQSFGLVRINPFPILSKVIHWENKEEKEKTKNRTIIGHIFGKISRGQSVV